MMSTVIVCVSCGFTNTMPLLNDTQYAVMQYGHQGSMNGAPYMRSKADIATKGLANIRCDRYDYLDTEFVRRKGRVPKANFVLAMYEERQRRRDVKLAIG